MDVRQVRKYGVEVWCNSEMDKLRRENCLCLNCARMANCVTASLLYELCKAENVATMMTRCPQWKPDLSMEVK